MKQACFVAALAAAVLVGCAFGKPSMETGAALSDSGDLADGYLTAQNICAECHAVSLNDKPSPAFGVPKFYEIAQDKNVSEVSLRAQLRTEHERMPLLVLGRERIDNVVAYILSMRGKTLPPPSRDDEALSVRQ